MEERNAGLSTENIFFMLENSEDISEELNIISADENEPVFQKCLTELMKERNINADKLGNAAFISRSFSFQICQGARVPSRDIIIRIALALELSLDETQRLLKLADRGVLYPKIKRDAVIVYAIHNRSGIRKTDEMLAEAGLEKLL